MMTKGMAALEIVFLLFIMIVVTLVVVRLIQNYVNIEPVVKTIKKWDEIEQINDLRTLCQNECDNYILHDCSTADAFTFCTQKLDIDLNGNKKTGETNIGAIVMGIPYCEDGMYCFNIKSDCKCFGQTLTDKECKNILCNYYKEKGYNPGDASLAIRGYITYGSCTVTDPAEKDQSFWYTNAQYDIDCP